jgi:hypothetical protein
MAWSAGVAAIRAGTMKGTLAVGLPSAASTKPHGSFSAMRKVRSSTALSSATNSNSFWPIESRLDQRCSEGITSAEVTALPSWNLRPGRRRNV